MSATLEHITVSTGNVRTSPRAEVEDAVVDAIRRALGHRGTGPLWDGWSVKSIQPAPAGTYVFDLFWRGEKLIACWLCSDPAQSEQLWQYPAQLPRPDGVDLSPPAGVPWLACAIVPPAAIEQDRRYLEALAIVGDVERCVAWALLPD